MPIQLDLAGKRFEGDVAEVLLLNMVTGLTSIEIAALTGANPTTVRVRIARAAARFRALYGKGLSLEL